MSVVIETTVGDITVDLFTEERPTTCMNFIKLCKMKYYNFNLIFSIERDFIAQTGDPTGTGRGGASVFQLTHGEKLQYYEGEKMPIIKHTSVGMISMASCGSGLYGSQFFVTLGNNLDSLDEEHLVFGQVVEGLEVLDIFNQTLIDDAKRPYQDILITHTVVLSDPFPDPKGLCYPCESPLPPEHLFNSNYISADEDVKRDDLKNLVEMQEEMEAKEAEARATILEMVGDLPSADMAPPENVLFVCKLNPVTTSEDLEVIFARFGKIVSAEVIRDHVTENSLQYAFIEFASKKSCEDAYFKMDNVLIDDRRIHVDFSQSVSKIKWKGKGRGVEYFDDSGRKVNKENYKNFDPYQNKSSHHNSNQRRLAIDNSKARDPLYQSKRREEFKPIKTAKRKRNKSDNSESDDDDNRDENELKIKSQKERRKIMKKLKKELKKNKKNKKSKKKKSKSKKKKKESSSSASSDSS
ncbi:Peptidyl-prolyl cis-trans isomerase-like 4 [Armadillidium nasatum]|uniref:Peptidyl-prolyl cis-trans isomerase n=1 Tax=Armadillidium nasatum TaxID=96803 RepID=A0A5N5TKI6_9CRUS|nr:Peptidyl-prolyl cis-trans isomerase-like 4 [Armadillidium nasatum]